MPADLRPVIRTHEADPDPRRRLRTALGWTASALMVLSVFFQAAVYGLASGDHSGLFRSTYGPREALIVLIGLGATWFVTKPFRPDPRVAQAAMLAAAIVALSLGVVLFFGALQVPLDAVVTESWPGPQAWMLLIAGILFVYLRWHRDLWPESPWAAEILSRAARRR